MGPSATSPNQGQLVVAGSAPGETPTDYRVRWAPSGQDYLANAEANTPEGSSAYPNTASFTVNNLSSGTEYKVQVRARNNQGQHEDNPWSNETTATVSSSPTPGLEPTHTAEPTRNLHRSL